MKRGFTPLGFILAVSVFFFFVTGAFAFVSHSWREARDEIRINDIRLIAEVLERYKSEHGTYPLSPEAAGRVSENTYLQEILAPYVAALPHDPEGEHHASYGYYYDSAYGCAEDTVAAVIALRMDQKINSNFDTVRSACKGRAVSASRAAEGSYTVFVGPLGDTP